EPEFLRWLTSRPARLTYWTGLQGLPASVVCEYRYRFAFFRGQAAVGRVQNDLVLPAFAARHANLLPAFDCGGEGVYLPRVGKLVGNRFFGCKVAVTPQLQLNQSFHIQRIVGPEDARVADNLQGRAIVGASCDH